MKFTDGSFSVEILKDSIGPKGHRITTICARYHRTIHDEMLTHKEFARNSASSRAIPIGRMIQDILDDPAIPVWWGQNEPGMQAYAEVEDKEGALAWWLDTRDIVIERAQQGIALGLHKQIVNRILQPWMWTQTLITSTSWSNFEGLRCHPAAEPNFQVIARLIMKAIKASVPQKLKYGEWHLPYVTTQDIVDDFDSTDSCIENLIKLSVGRCARVSYLTHEGKRDLQKDIELHDRMMVQVPLHASPAEHQAQAVEGMRSSGNLRGEWLQYRKTFANEYIGQIDPPNTADIITKAEPEITKEDKDKAYKIANSYTGWDLADHIAEALANERAKKVQ